MSERFIVAESSGYLIRADNKPGGGSGWVTEYMVQDTAYCHTVVWTSLRNTSDMRLGPRSNRRSVSAREREWNRRKR